MTIKTLIVDDHPLFLAGIRKLLELSDGIFVVGEAHDGLEAIEAVKEFNPEIVVMDITMPKMNGIEATKEILKFSPETKILALSIHSGKRFVKEMLNAGASGYLLKDSAPDELISAIHKIADGDMYLSSSITSIALSKELPEEEEKPNLNILTTKLHRPPTSSDSIVRNKIIHLLEANIYKPASLVVAPAGYGKSVTVSQWLEQTKALHTWISLDEEQNDLRIFLFYIHAAIDKIFPGSLKNTRELINASALPPLKVIAFSLINELDAIDKDFILVLDDYHRISDESIHILIDEILRFPPEHMHLSIITRKDPPLKLSTLLLNNRLTEVRMSDLSFTKKEIRELFQQQFGVELGKETTESLKEKTEGWIAGIRMAFLSISSPEDAENILSNIRGDTWSLSNYLVDEVLVKQSDNIQDLLLSSSILNRFCASLIDDIYKDKPDIKVLNYSGSEFIEWLIKSNLFIIPLDSEGLWFRYHHLIQDLLQKRLKSQRSAEEISPYHQRASSWFERHNFIEESIKHMLAGDDPGEACQIVERHRRAELDNDRWYILQRWLSYLPEELKRRSPDLLLSEAWGAYENFQLEKIPVLVDLVKPLLKDNKKDRGLLGESYLMLGLVFHWSGEAEQALQYFQKALALLPERHKLAMGMLHLHIGLASSVSGKKETAIKNLKVQLKGGHSDPVYQTRLMAGIVYINLFAGELQIARHEAQQMQIIAKKNHLVYTHAMAICMESTACFNAYQLKEASDLFEQAAQQRYNLHIGVALDALAGQAITYQLLNQADKADESLVLLESFEKELDITGSLPITSSCGARLSLLRDDVAPALAWANTVDAPPSFAGLFVWLEVPAITQARVFIYEGSKKNLANADNLLNAILSVCNKCHLDNQIIEILVLQSLLYEKQGLHEKALETLKDALLKGEHGEWVRPFVEAESLLSGLLKALQEKGFAVQYISRILKIIEDQSTFRVRKELKEPETITPRQLEIISLLAKGLRNKEIGDKLFISEGTIKKHIYNLCQKFSIKNRMGLIIKAKELGYIK